MRFVPFAITNTALLALTTLPAPAQSLGWSGRWFSPSRHRVDGPFASFDPDGGGPLRHRLFAAYLSDYAQSVSDSRIPYWDGERWSHLPGAPNPGGITAYAVMDADGTGPQREALYAAGNFTQIGGVQVQRCARFDGTIWTAVGAFTQNDTIRALCVVADAGGQSRLYAGGEFRIGVSQQCTVMRLDPSGWTPVGPPSANTLDQVHALAEFQIAPGTTTLHAAGHFSTIGGVPAANIARWNGSAWEPLGAGMNDDVRVLTTFTENGGTPVLIAGGEFTSAGGLSAPRIARWNGSAWSTLQGGILAGGSSPRVDALQPFDSDGPGGAPPVLFVGGDFNGYVDAMGAGHLSPNTVLWNGSSWSTLAGNPTTPVRWMATFDDGSGERVWCNAGLNQYPQESGQADVLEWNGAHWISVGRGVANIVHGLASWDDDGPGPHPLELFAAGAFEFAGDASARYVARWDGYEWRSLGPVAIPRVVRALMPFDADGPGGQPEKLWIGYEAGLATWDGTTQQVAYAGTSSDRIEALAVFDEGHGAGPQLVAGGSLTISGAGDNIGIWDGMTLVPVGRGVSSNSNAIPVLCLEVFDEDGAGPLPPALFVGGNVRSATGPGQNHVLSNNNLVRWNGTVWSEVSDYSTNDTVEDFAVFDFDGAGPQAPRLCIAFAGGVRTWDGQTMTALGPGWSGGRALGVFDDGVNGPALYAANDFNGYAQMWRWSGVEWIPCGGRAGNRILTLQPFRDPRLGLPALIAAGEFLYVDGAPQSFDLTPSSFLAAWMGTGVQGAPQCLGDGSSSDCPCGNASLPGAASGCLNSFAVGARLVAEGTPSLQMGSLSLVATQMPNSFALFFQGTSPVNGGLGSAFGDGLRCAGGSVVRLATRLNVAGSSGYPAPGEPSISTAGLVTAPGLRIYQVWYRNAAAFCTSGTFNLTNAWNVQWTL